MKEKRKAIFQARVQKRCSRPDSKEGNSIDYNTENEGVEIAEIIIRLYKAGNRRTKLF